MRCLPLQVLPGILLCVSIGLCSQGAEPRTIGQIIRLDPALDQLLPQNTEIEVLGDGFAWSEGPVWIPSGQYALFSDIPRNQIVRWKSGFGISIFRERVGYAGQQVFTGREPGTNGLALDPRGHLVACCHGDRSIKRMNDNGEFEELVSRYQGKRLNSPNDAVLKSNGDLYFTDPP